jgi:hypothetical protein
LRFLADKGAKIEVWNRKNKYGWTPLMIAGGQRPGNFKPSAENRGRAAPGHARRRGHTTGTHRAPSGSAGGLGAGAAALNRSATVLKASRSGFAFTTRRGNLQTSL